MDQYPPNSVCGRQWKEIVKVGKFCSVQFSRYSIFLMFIRYLHAVTKAKNRTLAPETGGGILADEMGMGKSLSTLALITKTLDNARDWALEKKANPDPNTRQKPCIATLVVVPSASMPSCPLLILSEILTSLDFTFSTDQ
jgi:hypothetical protein